MNIDKKTFVVGLLLSLVLSASSLFAATTATSECAAHTNSCPPSPQIIIDHPKHKNNPILSNKSSTYPNIQIVNSFGDVGGKGALDNAKLPDPKNNISDLYKDLANNVAQTAKDAIGRSEDVVDAIKWVFTVISLIFAGASTILAIYGIKSFNDLKENLKTSMQSRMDDVIAKAEKDVKESNSKISDGSLVSYYITNANLKSLHAEHLDNLRIDPQTSKEQAAKLRIDSSRLMDEAVFTLSKALNHVDNSNEIFLAEVNETLMRSGVDRSIPSAIFLKYWIYLTLGWCSKRRGNIAEAISYVEKARALHPKDGYVLYNLACYNALAGKHKESFDFLSEALAEDPSMSGSAKEDEDFTLLRQVDLPRFESLVGKNATN